MTQWKPTVWKKTKKEFKNNLVFGNLCMNLTWFEFSDTRSNNWKLRDVTASFDLYTDRFWNMSLSKSRPLFQIKWETLALRSLRRHWNKVKPPTEANSSPLQNKTSPLGFGLHNELFSCDSVQSLTYDCHSLNSYNICLCGTTESIQRVDGTTMETFCFVSFFCYVRHKIIGTMAGSVMAVTALPLYWINL